MTANEIRLSFLKYFERNGHRIVPSSPLVPHDDPTLLFTNAGMNQFKDVFLGKEKREYRRACSSQKCVRAGGKHNDLENVGRTARHLTFFEMLGNFSFGDYFKEDAIKHAWTLLVDVWGLDKERLWFTVFEGDDKVSADDEAAALWVKAGASPDRVLRFGKKDNFWSMGDTGPCGPCSEIHYFRGDHLSRNVAALVNGPGDDTMEMWNLVFMQYDRDAAGTLTPLPAPSVDTGMGLERITSVLQHVPTVYEIDSFQAIMKTIEQRSRPYGANMEDELDTAMRVLCDHARSATFLIGDGVIPSNEGRGYVLRRIIRRGIRFGRKLPEPVMLSQLVDSVITTMGGAYPELEERRVAVLATLTAEEERFSRMLTSGMERVGAVIDGIRARGERTIGGAEVFRLYDSYGIPVELIAEIAEEEGLALDREGFEEAMKGQRQKARAKSKFGAGSLAPTVWQTRNVAGEDLAEALNGFRGYDLTTLNTRVIELLDSNRIAVDHLDETQEGFVALRETPFYLESGGQVSDIGAITGPNGEAAVVDVVRGPDRMPRFHEIRVAHGAINYRDLVTATVNTQLRDATRRNHTATHLLHAALRQVLGTHVKQAGSLVAPDRLRFDFVHFSAVTHEQLLEIERIVNEQVLKNTPVQTEVKATQDAIAAGAMALFGEKYGDKVRVVSVPGFSVELCGGTHVRATGDIGLFAIVSESGVAAGTRRIEAITGMDAVEWAQSNRLELQALRAAIRADEGPPALVGLRRAGGIPDTRAAETLKTIETVRRLHSELKALTRELQQAKMKAAMGGGSAGQPEEAVDVAGVKLVAREVSGVDKDGLRALVDQHRARIKSGVVVLAAPGDDKVTIVVGVTPDLTRKVPAGQVVKQLAAIVGGGGGGRPDFAEAGGKDLSKVGEMLAATRGIIEKMITGAP